MLVPESFFKEDSGTLLKQIRNLHLIPVPDSLILKRSPDKLDRLYRDIPGIEQVVKVLPRSLLSSASVEYWPAPLYKKADRVVLYSTVFAADASELVMQFTNLNVSSNIACNVTCQYESPYTDCLEEWQRAGAVAFHPGDYYRQEILSEFKNMTGAWLYFGHATQRELCGYAALDAAMLKSNLPKKPLDLVAWFSCSTLQRSATENLAVSYYRSGATRCLFAAKGKPPTVENTFLVKELLREFTEGRPKSFGAALVSIGRRSPVLLSFANLYYRILGLPWSKIFLSNKA